MSWQAYIDTSLVGSGHIDQAAIFGVNGVDEWAHSEDFKVSPEEVKVILQSYKDPQSVLVGGFKVNGVKYLAISTPDMEGNLNMLLGKKGKEGLVVAKTNQALILAHHSEATLTVSCVGVVEDLAAYLKSQGY